MLNLTDGYDRDEGQAKLPSAHFPHIFSFIFSVRALKRPRMHGPSWRIESGHFNGQTLDYLRDMSFGRDALASIPLSGQSG